MSSGGMGSGLYKSIDGGDTWKEITNPNWIRDNNNASKRRLRLASEIRTSLGLYP